MNFYSASLTGVFRIILLILAFIVAARILGRLLSPFLRSDNSNSGNNFQNTRDQKRPDGDVRVEYTNEKTKKKGDSGEGEYIDFEELD